MLDEIYIDKIDYWILVDGLEGKLKNSKKYIFNIKIINIFWARIFFNTLLSLYKLFLNKINSRKALISCYYYLFYILADGFYIDYYTDN